MRASWLTRSPASLLRSRFHGGDAVSVDVLNAMADTSAWFAMMGRMAVERSPRMGTIAPFTLIPSRWGARR